MSKEDIRKEKLSERLRLKDEYVAEHSRAIMERLAGMPELSNAKTVFVYVSAKKEVSTCELITEMLRSGKKVLVPVSNPASRQITVSELHDLSELCEGNFGILEPRKEFMRPAAADCIDVSIIPGTAFDENGNRLGYGHGYYDRFLAQTSAPVIALAYEFQIVDEISPCEHDVKVDKIVTEKRIIGCG